MTNKPETLTPAGINLTHVPFDAADAGTRRALAEAQRTVLAARMLPLWVITANPSDLPGLFVARLNVSSAGGVYVTGIAVKHPALQAVREALPAGLVRMPRADGDEPQIVETWL